MSEKQILRVTTCITHGSQGIFNLTIRDQSSGIEFVDIEMSAEQFADTITAHSTMDVQCEVRGLHLLGMQIETKQEIVPFEHRYERDEEKRQSAANAAISPFEVDGWKGRVDDLFNPHHNAGSGKHRVTFTRYVAKPQNPLT